MRKILFSLKKKKNNIIILKRYNFIVCYFYTLLFIFIINIIFLKRHVKQGIYNAVECLGSPLFCHETFPIRSEITKGSPFLMNGLTFATLF